MLVEVEVTTAFQQRGLVKVRLKHKLMGLNLAYDAAQPSHPAGAFCQGILPNQRPRASNYPGPIRGEILLGSDTRERGHHGVYFAVETIILEVRTL